MSNNPGAKPFHLYLREQTAHYGTQTAFGKALNRALIQGGQKPITKASVSQWFRGDNEPDDTKLPIIATVIQRPIEEIRAAKHQSRAWRIRRYEPEQPGPIEEYAMTLSPHEYRIINLLRANQPLAAIAQITQEIKP